MLMDCCNACRGDCEEGGQVRDDCSDSSYGQASGSCSGYGSNVQYVGVGYRQYGRHFSSFHQQQRHSTRDGGPTSGRLQGTVSVSVRTELSTTRPLPEVPWGHPQIHVTLPLPASTVTKPPSVSADVVSAKKFMMCLKPTVLITSSPW